MNWGDIRAAARVRLADPSAKIWSNAELLVHANHVFDDITIQSEATLDDEIIPMVSGTRTYSMPTNLFELRGVKVNGKKMFGTQAFRLEELDSQYLTGTGTPQWYYLEDAETIAFYPIPSWTPSYTPFVSDLGVIVQYNDGSSNLTFTSEFGLVTDIIDDASSFQYVQDSLLGIVIAIDANAFVAQITFIEQIPDLVNDSDTPDLPAYMHYAILYGVLEKAFSRDGQGQNLVLMKFFGDRCNELKTEWYARNREFSHGQAQFASQKNVDWGSDMDWRFRIWP